MMNRGHVLQSSPVQQMMAGGPNWWNMINNRKPPPLPHPSFRQPSPNFFPQFIPPPLPPSRSWHDDNHEELPDSWSQLLFGGLVGDQEDKAGVSPIQPKKLENWEEEIVQQAPSAAAVDIIKQENSNSGSSYVYGGSNAEECDGGKLPADWSHTMPWPASSPNSCVTTLSTNILDFSNNKADGKHPPPDRSSECTIGGGLKKARVQASSTQCFKVRKEKLGDRITALHQLVSPFGKTDTASVLLEAIGYIRFLHAQVEALSVPYLGNGTGSIKSQQFVQGEMNCLFPEDPGQLLNDNSCTKRKGTSAQEDYDEETPKELRSRGLCLVPTSSCTLQVGSGNGADYWAPTFGGGFR